MTHYALTGPQGPSWGAAQEQSGAFLLLHSPHTLAYNHVTHRRMEAYVTIDLGMSHTFTSELVSHLLLVHTCPCISLITMYMFVVDLSLWDPHCHVCVDIYSIHVEARCNQFCGFGYLLFYKYMSEAHGVHTWTVHEHTANCSIARKASWTVGEPRTHAIACICRVGRTLHVAVGANVPGKTLACSIFATPMTWLFDQKSFPW